MRKIKTYFRAAGALAVVLLFSIAFSVFAFGKMSPTEARSSVVAIMNSEGGMGSGFAIGRLGEPVEYIVTNKHVITSQNSGEVYTTAIVYFSMASDDKMLANVYYSDPQKDLAILKLPEKTDLRQPLTLCPMEYVDIDNDSFSALGYPGNQVTDWPKYNTDDITITKGGIKKIDRVNGMDVYDLDLDITHGNSGGPLINSDGEVIGINSFGAKTTNNNYAIAIDELISVIDTNKIPISLHGTNIMLYVVIGGAVVLLAILVVVIILVAKKSKNSSVPVPSMNGNPAPSFNSIERNGPAPMQMNNMNTPVQNTASMRLIAIGGTLNGKKFSVSGKVTMGRDASKCAVSFPVNTQGVSAVHCEVSFDGRVCYVTDLNSSYGTFLQNGTKLQPNSPQMFNSGDKFYLAGPENTFEVRF